MINIFDQAKEKVMPKWAKFEKDGDSAQGTYVGKIVGVKDGYNNEQIVYQLLQEDESVLNVGFGLNKKVLHQDMDSVKFGQIIGFKYKGKITVKDKFGKTVEVKDFSIYQDPKIVNSKWLGENEKCMPEVIHSSPASEVASAPVVSTEKEKENDVPFSSAGSLTNEDKLAVIEKMAKDKLGATDGETTKTLVMEKLGIAFIPVNYDKIVEALATM